MNEDKNIKFLFNICPTKTRDNPNQGRVYDVTGIAPALNTKGGGNLEPFILVKANTKAGYEVAEPGDTINLAYPNSTTRRGRVGKRVAQTLTSSPPQQGVVIMKEGEENMTAEMKTPCLLTLNNFSHKAGDGVDSRKKNVAYIHPALQANPGGSQQTYLCNDEMQVRKLTPKECFRLMGFDDSDVDLLMKNGMSNTQLYKMAGNSIVVTMLEYLFCQIFDSNDEIWV